MTMTTTNGVDTRPADNGMLGKSIVARRARTDTELNLVSSTTCIIGLYCISQPRVMSSGRLTVFGTPWWMACGRTDAPTYRF